jgi:hypothetical protein
MLGEYIMIAKNGNNKKLSEAAKKNTLCDADLLLQYCNDMNDWPKRWEIDTIDIEIGQAIVEQFKPFLIDKIKKGRAKKNINTHAYYLFALGGELISRLNVYQDERRLSAREFILERINATGGTYWRHAYDEAAHDRYDTTCRQLFKFMTMNSD